MTTLLTPWGYNITLGTTSAQILPSNPARKGLIFFNPGANTIAICPALTPAQAALAAVINGAGSMNLVSFGTLILPQAGWPPDVGIGSAFNGIASAPGTPFTIWEF